MANRELACVAGVWKGREREFWEREFQAREKREGRARKQTRAWSRALIPFPFPFPTPATQVNRELEQRRRRRLQGPQKQKLLIGKTTTLHVPHAFLYISLPSLRDYDVAMPNFTWRFVEDANTRQRLSFLFLNFDTVFYNSTPEKTANIWRNWTRWNKRNKVWHI